VQHVVKSFDGDALAEEPAILCWTTAADLPDAFRAKAGQPISVVTLGPVEMDAAAFAAASGAVKEGIDQIVKEAAFTVTCPPVFLAVRAEASLEFKSQLPQFGASGSGTSNAGEPVESLPAQTLPASGGNGKQASGVVDGRTVSMEKTPKIVIDLDGRPWSLCNDNSAVQQRMADCQFMCRIASGHKLDLLGITRSFSVDSREFLAKHLEACRPFREFTANEEHFRSAGILSTRMAAASVITVEERFDEAIRGKWRVDGAGGSLSLRDFYHGGADNFPVNQSDRSANAAFRLQVASAVRGVFDLLTVLGGEEYAGAGHVLTDFLEAPDNFCHGIKDLMVFDTVNGGFATVFTELRSLRRADPLFGSAAVLLFIRERMRIMVNTLRRLAAPEGVAMENYFFEHVLKRMEWDRKKAGATSRATVQPTIRGATAAGVSKAAAVPKSGGPPATPSALCGIHLKFILNMDNKPCSRAPGTCQYHHFDKRLKKVTADEFKQMVQASSIKALWKSEICAHVDKNPKRFKK
jgi:hypothetical protein